jgi:hypothetical protein
MHLLFKIWLFNVLYDGAVSHLDLQPIIPLTSEIEKSDLNAILVMMKGQNLP